jgi:hypothetical protein
MRATIPRRRWRRLFALSHSPPPLQSVRLHKGIENIMKLRIAILAACAGTLALAASTGTFAKEIKTNSEMRQTCCVASGDVNGDGFGRRRSKANTNKETGGLFNTPNLGMDWGRRSKANTQKETGGLFNTPTLGVEPDVGGRINSDSGRRGSARQ